ncbi:MAG TPA: hypothetical protein VMT76_16820 [Puia sp.]|nr:hypothetical protein [Puia sp.]
MKNAFVQLCLILLVITGVHAMKLIRSNTISGKVNAPNALQFAWAIQDKDSVIVACPKGAFTLKVKPGVWRVLLHTKFPYKNQVIDNVVVNAGRSTDLGEIILAQ